jgi:hypothetical protein
MDLNISEHNKQVHVDIEEDIQKQQNGLYTIILRVHNNKIVDKNVVEYVDITDYAKLKRIVIEQVVIQKPGLPRNNNI